jgi:hypothetical protein
MRRFILIFVFWAASLSLPAQQLTYIGGTINRDTTVATVQNIVFSDKAVTASGQAEFSSNLGYVRILLSDDYDYDLLIYESTPLVATNGIDNFSNMAFESVDIPHALPNLQLATPNVISAATSINICNAKNK